MQRLRGFGLVAAESGHFGNRDIGERTNRPALPCDRRRSSHGDPEKLGCQCVQVMRAPSRIQHETLEHAIVARAAELHPGMTEREPRMLDIMTTFRDG